jgi:hypothetical protein
MKDGGWLDNYGKKPNPNEVDVSVGPGFVGMGNDTTGRDYSPAWGGQFQSGGFLQPISYKLPSRYRIPYAEPSTELATSIGGEKGEPAYLIPTFKGGKDLKDPVAEYRKTGEHLGGPFKTWQEAEKWEQEIRHPYVEKGKPIPTPLKRWGDMQSGGRLPIITNDPKDKRLKAYQDSLNLYNIYNKVYQERKKSGKVTSEYPYENFKIAPVAGKVNNVDAYVSNKKSDAYRKNEIQPISEYSYTDNSQDRYVDGEFYPGSKDATFFSHRFKKPIQSVVYKKSEREPIVVNDPKDPKLKAYQDSLNLYNKTKDIQNPKYYTDGDPSWYNWKGNRKDAERFMRRNNIDLDYEYYRTNKFPGKIQPIKTGDFGEGMVYPIYKKPTQPVEYKKLEEIKPTQPTPKGSKKYIVNGMEVSEEDFLGSGATTGGRKRIIYNTPNKGTQKVLRLDGTPETDPDKIRRALATAQKDNMAMGGSLPGAVGFTYARVAGSAPANGKYAKKTKASAQNGKEMKFYQEGLDFKPNSIAQDGEAIVDPMGQWAHPGEVTIIPATDITMEGVDYPVLGISDTGDQQMMYPGEDYDFDGEYVTEYPMMQEGGWLNKYQDGGGLSRSNLEMMSTLEKDIKNQKARNAQATISQYTPKPGDQQRMNAAKDAYRAEEAKPLNRAASSRVAAKAMENIVEPMINIETGLGASKLLKPALKTAGKYLTQKTALKNAEKKLVFENASVRGPNAYTLKHENNILGDFDLEENWEKPGEWTTALIEIDPKFQGKGFGKQAYIAANDMLKNSGRGTLHSSGNFYGDDAKHLWNSLVKSGHAESVGKDSWRFKQKNGGWLNKYK